MRWDELPEQSCSLSRAVSVVGDRWTLLILKECFLRVHKFEELQQHLGISRAILADRLQKLVDAFVLVKVAYQKAPVRYEYRLTSKGLDLYPVIMSLVHWGDVHAGDGKGRPALHVHLECRHQFEPVMVCSECASPLDPRAVGVMPGPGATKKDRERTLRTARERNLDVEGLGGS